MTMIRRTVFIDRDGVINRDSRDYIKTRDEFQFLPGSLDALKLLTRNRYRIIVITNQSVIGRKLTSLDELHLIFNKMTQAVEEAGGHITDIFFCPHAPWDNCRCRKPMPGMIEDAAAKHHIDLKTAVMVGDSAKDIQCGKNAGVCSTVLVKTGNGEQAEIKLEQDGIVPDFVAEDLLAAALWIMKNDGIHD